METTKQKQGAAPKLLTKGSSGGPTHDEIARQAYSLWEQRGRPQDQEVGLWLQAEEQLRQQQVQNGLRA